MRFWSLAIKKKCGKRVSSRLLSRLATSLNINYPLKISLEEMKERRQDARKKYNKMKPCAKELRKLFLEKKIEKSALDSDFDKAKIIKQISKEEENERHIPGDSCSYYNQIGTG